MVTESSVQGVLAEMQDPHADVSLTDAGFVRGVGVDGGKVAVELALGYPAAGWHEALKAEVRAAVSALPGVEQVAVNIGTRIVAHQVQDKLSPLPGVKNIIAVASGKGGVGKSTTSVNLALALQADGARVGVLDADIYGPSIPRMLGVSGKPETTAEKRILPKLAHGLQAMSIGLLIDEDTPMIWRGPMVTQAMQQLLTETLWDELDYL
ncbi:MAG: P-loop NTPase, partial [Xanthomonadales bacterium]|nr:P-loop NTPase [Xanthomonadales bacterium]